MFSHFTDKRRKRLFSKMHISAVPVPIRTCDSALERQNDALSVCHGHIFLLWKSLITKKSVKICLFLPFYTQKQKKAIFNNTHRRKASAKRHVR